MSVTAAGNASKAAGSASNAAEAAERSVTLGKREWRVKTAQKLHIMQ